MFVMPTMRALGLGCVNREDPRNPPRTKVHRWFLFVQGAGVWVVSSCGAPRVEFSRMPVVIECRAAYGVTLLRPLLYTGDL